ncbi:hypothetical protein MUP59_08200 [Candidatus Bathyarchaeota archaeon]|nr:hypothetical protein [Candidatus Bathyarchaeota archaeon]
MKLNNLVGKRFGRWTVIERAPTIKRHTFWHCKCDCGKEANVEADSLAHGGSISCGCYKNELHTTHGMSQTCTYASWKAMWARCTYPKLKAYKYYGGQGIKVCERWRDFESFCADMGEKPTPKHTLDRIDGKDNYCPENCRWATRQEQSENHYNNHNLTYNGKTQCLAVWAKELKIHKNTLDERLKRGWSVEKTLSTPRMQEYSHGGNRKNVYS